MAELYEYNGVVYESLKPAQRAQGLNSEYHPINYLTTSKDFGQFLVDYYNHIDAGKPSLAAAFLAV